MRTKLTGISICLFVFCMLSFVPMVPPDNTDYITSGAWQLVTSTIYPALDTNGSETTDYLSLWDICLTDDSIVFSADSLLLLYDNYEDCDTAYDGTYAMLWYFDSTETSISFRNSYFHSMKYASDLVLLNQDSFVISFEEVFSGDTFTITNTYVHF